MENLSRNKYGVMGSFPYEQNPITLHFIHPFFLTTFKNDQVFCHTK